MVKKPVFFAYLPSKKIIIAFFAAVLLIGGSFFLSKKEQAGKKDLFNLAEKENSVSQMFKGNQDDSDSDGLKDWEEILWGSDPQNPDTDSDGTQDGEEVKQNRNPAKPGPDDKLENAVPAGAGGSEAGTQTSGYSMTESMTRNFMSSYMNMRQYGELDETTKENLVQAFADSVSQENLIDAFSISKLNTTNDNRSETLKTYGNNLGKISQSRSYESAGSKDNEQVIMQIGISSEDENEMKKLEPIIGLYENYAKDTLNLKVPGDLALYHLDIVNGMYNISIALRNIRGTLTDPVRGMAGLAQYKKEASRVAEAFGGIKKYFTNKAVFFNQNDNGYVLFK